MDLRGPGDWRQSECRDLRQLTSSRTSAASHASAISRRDLHQSRARRHQAVTRSGLTGSFLEESIHGYPNPCSAFSNSKSSIETASSDITRRFAVFVGSSRNIGFRDPSPLRRMAILESMTRCPASRSSQRRAANSDRRAPVTAASRIASAASGSMRPAATSDAALESTARTSVSVSVPRGWDLRLASRATATTFVGTHPQRTASVSAARSTRCRLRIADSPTPRRSRRACHWSTSTAVSLEIERFEMRSDLTSRIRLSWLLSVEGDQDALVFSAHRSSISETETRRQTPLAP